MFWCFFIVQSQMFSCLLMIMMMPRMGERMPTNERENECSMCEFVCLSYLVNRHKKLIFISFVVRISTSTPSLKTHFVCLLLDECCWEGGWVGLGWLPSRVRSEFETCVVFSVVRCTLALFSSVLFVLFVVRVTYCRCFGFWEAECVRVLFLLVFVDLNFFRIARP